MDGICGCGEDDPGQSTFSAISNIISALSVFGASPDLNDGMHSMGAHDQQRKGVIAVVFPQKKERQRNIDERLIRFQMRCTSELPIKTARDSPSLDLKSPLFFSLGSGEIRAAVSWCSHVLYGWPKPINNNSSMWLDHGDSCDSRVVCITWWYVPYKRSLHR